MRINDGMYSICNNKCLENGRSINPLVNVFSENLLDAYNVLGWTVGMEQ